MSGNVITKNQFESMIGTYKTRIKKHEENIRSLRKKIKSCQRRADRFGLIRAKLDKINEAVEEFTGVSLRKIGSAWEGDKKNAKNLFYKYCLENGISARDVAEFCGLSNRMSPTTRRREFTKSFKKNRGNKELYARFLIFANEIL